MTIALEKILQRVNNVSKSKQSLTEYCTVMLFRDSPLKLFTWFSMGLQ